MKRVLHTPTCLVRLWAVLILYPAGLGVVVGTFTWVGCDGRSVSATGDDAVVVPEGGWPDAGEAPDASSQVDAGDSWCSCPDGPNPGEEDPVLIYHECVPPLQHGCIATTCTPDQEGQCGEGYSCLECAAAACCICAACVPACVFTDPTQGPIPEYLKLTPTRGTLGEDSRVMIQGFPFYIGALGYDVRLGLEGEPLWSMNSGVCSLEVQVPSRQQEGVTSVWVSSYGFSDPWTLAGFFFWQEDPYEWEGCVQPGFPCGGQGLCCETPDVPMRCHQGRCVHQ